MKSKIFVLVVIMVLLFVSFGAQAPVAEAQSLVTIYVVPAITDVKILPTSSISSSYISDEISIVASPGEYEPASFVIRADEDVASLEVEATSLTGAGGSIPSDNVDIRVVKCWYQGGYDLSVGCYGRYLTPELLLKDDSLVMVEGTDWSNPNGHNYLKLTSGEYIWISESDGTYSGKMIIPITDRPVRDSSTLQPVDIPDGYNKQFWVTIKVPNGALAGLYTGSIELRTGAELIGELQLQLEVLPINLSEPYMTRMLFYRGRLKDSGSISSEDKNEEQYRAEMENIFNHGETNPTVYSLDSLAGLGEVLTIRNEAGMGDQPLYHLGSAYGSYENLVNFAKSYGATEVYLYGADETSDPDSMRPYIDAVHEAGGKVFCGLFRSNAFKIADVLDLVIGSGDPDPSLAATYHGYGHKVFSYGNPQVVPEFPETFRRNYGLLLWQRDYDGEGDYAYQASFDDIWNDFDAGSVRDHVFAYPTMDGVIDTVQWEGWREGVDDVRYLTSLLNVIEEAEANGKDTSTAESWLADLKSSDLTTRNLDSVRSEMIDHILYLLEEAPPDTTPPVIGSVAASGITGSSATITWTTDEPATSQVEYGVTEELGLSSDLDTSLLTNHSVSLTGLDSSTTYYYQVKSSDASGNLATSDIYSFVTLPPDTTPPVIASVAASGITGSSATITWTTDEPATSQVEYGITKGLGLSSDLDSSLLTDHSVSLAGLDSSTTYYYQVKSSDASGNLATSDIYSFTTSPPPNLSISFIPPTDGDGAVVDRDWTEVNTSTDSTYDVSSFIDWNGSLVGYWNFNENSGAIAGDKSSYGNNGALIDDPQWTTGKFGYALKFDGVDDYVDCGNDASLNITGDKVTIEAWIKPITTGTEMQYITDKADFYHIAKDPGNQIEFVLTTSDGFYHPEKGTVNIGVWNHIVVTYDGSLANSNMKWYFDGILVGNSEATGTINDSSANRLYVGGRGTSYSFNGLIDEVRIWNRALSPEEIKASYNTKIYSLSYTFTNLADGTYQYYAYTTDTNGNSAQTETRTLTIETTPTSYPPGDANQDGNVDGLDITKVERIIMGLDDPTPSADANGDDNINTLDITQIELIIMGG